MTDDQPSMLDLMDRALGDSYDCEFAGNINEARRQLAGSLYDLVICNLSAVGESGLNLAEEIARDYPDTATIVLLTGRDDPEAARQAFANGIYAYLVEPFWPGQLLITVMNSLRRRELELIQRNAARDAEEQRQHILDMVPMAVYVKGLSGTYSVANSMANELAGLGDEGLIGRTDEAVLSPEERSIGSESDRRVMVEGIPHEREDSAEIAGVRKTFKTIRFPLRDVEGEIIAVGGISVDVSAEHEAILLREEMAESRLRAIEELQLSQQETIEGLTKAIDLHDAATGAHVMRIAAITRLIGTQLGLDPEFVHLLRTAAPMHDVGKIGIPAEILRKPGPLTEKERAIMMRHTVIGHEIFAGFESKLAQLAGSIALTHHERCDGSGYPRGLEGSQIPVEGRITAVADVFDALISNRSYRRAFSVSEAVSYVGDGRKSQFDTEVVDCLLLHLDEVVSICKLSIGDEGP